MKPDQSEPQKSTTTKMQMEAKSPSHAAAKNKSSHQHIWGKTKVIKKGDGAEKLTTNL